MHFATLPGKDVEEQKAQAQMGCMVAGEYCTHVRLLELASPLDAVMLTNSIHLAKTQAGEVYSDLLNHQQTRARNTQSNPNKTS